MPRDAILSHGSEIPRWRKLELTVAGFDYLGLNPGINNVLDGCNRGMHTVHCGGIYDSYLQIPVIPTEV